MLVGASVPYLIFSNIYQKMEEKHLVQVAGERNARAATAKESKIETKYQIGRTDHS